MPNDKFDFGELLAVLEAKRAALDALIGTFRAALSIGALGQLGDVDITTIGAGAMNRSGGSIDLPQGVLLGKSLPAAIQLILSAARRKLTTKEVVTALKEGGAESTSRHFENTVSTALYRLKQAGTVLKFNDGWSLAEFYPENLRNRLSAHADQKLAEAKKAAAPKRRKAKKPSRVLAQPTLADLKAAAV